MIFGFFGAFGIFCDFGDFRHVRWFLAFFVIFLHFWHFLPETAFKAGAFCRQHCHPDFLLQGGQKRRSSSIVDSTIVYSLYITIVYTIWLYSLNSHYVGHTYFKVSLVNRKRKKVDDCANSLKKATTLFSCNNGLRNNTSHCLPYHYNPIWSRWKWF